MSGIVRYLSPEWLEALHEVAAHSETLRRHSVGMSLVVQQTVTSDEGDDITYHLLVDDGEVALRPGPADEPTVGLRTDLPTATAIARGERGVHSALVSGELEIRGDVAALLDHQVIFADLNDVFITVRARTEW